jgi:hypothetical protein
LSRYCCVEADIHRQQALEIHSSAAASFQLWQMQASQLDDEVSYSSEKSRSLIPCRRYTGGGRMSDQTEALVAAIVQQIARAFFI